ncbi:MAG TPA: ABC transporter ATP-binding protein [Gemmatimonadaceae bacterium]|jgi:ABC-type Fe3+/spermidine/putrescine transport system ATPase subunit|nr:ABC transporter ATP-binding protein [Gemmatimonadaceae bacterium]
MTVSAEGLSVQHITRRFEGRAAVDDVSFDVPRGELVALVGASGSGKTTSLRIVAGYDTPDIGAVRFGGVDITKTPPEKRGFGMVFQHYALFPHMSVVENVAFGLEARGISKAERLRRAERALDSVGLQGKGNRRVQQLSGGEQQRVALARAVVIEPNVLLLDEPLSNLDPALRQSTRDELRAMLHRVGAPALFVTHDQEDAFAVADRIVLLSKGRVLQIGTPEELYAHPASHAVAAFIGRASLVPAQDRGASAVVSLGGVTVTLDVTRAPQAPPSFPEAFVVLRPEALTLTAPETTDAWPGVVKGRRFAGASMVYHVQLSDTVTVEVQSTRRASEGDPVGVAPGHIPVPIVPA